MSEPGSSEWRARCLCQYDAETPVEVAVATLLADRCRFLARGIRRALRGRDSPIA